MKLFVFRADWEYCCGATVIIANSFEDAAELIKDDGDSFMRHNSFHKTEEDSNEHRKKSQNGLHYPWILMETINVGENETPRVVCCEYNYA